MLYTLPSGEKQAFPCVLSLFDYDFSGGSTFRVIKEIGDYTAAAEFTLTKGAVISAETPYGFGPMEEVPEYGDPAELAAGGAVVFTEAGTENADAAETFLEKVSLGIPCQLRTLQNYYESWPMLIDVIYDGRRLSLADAHRRGDHGEAVFLHRDGRHGRVPLQRRRLGEHRSSTTVTRRFCCPPAPECLPGTRGGGDDR